MTNFECMKLSTVSTCDIQVAIPLWNFHTHKYCLQGSVKQHMLWTQKCKHYICRHGTVPLE